MLSFIIVNFILMKKIIIILLLPFLFFGLWAALSNLVIFMFGMERGVNDAIALVWFIMFVVAGAFWGIIVNELADQGHI
jgi:hypothetical protein